MKERELNLIDLMVEILLKWRVIIAWMLVGGILMGGLGYMRSYHTAQTQKAALKQEQSEQIAALVQAIAVLEVEEINIDELLDGLTDLQINNVNLAIQYEKLVESKGAYLQDSIVMQIDPMNEPRALLTFQVVAGNVETTRKIVQVYEDMIGGLSQWLADEVQGDGFAAAFSELVSLSRSSTETLEGGDSFRISVCHISEERCLQLAEKVDTYFQEQQSQLVDKMGEHQIWMVNQEFSYVMDTELLDKRQEIENSIMSWSTAAAKLKDVFSEEEWQYYNYLTKGTLFKISFEEQQAEEGEEDNEGEEKPAITIIQPSVSKKNVLLGMVLFAFLYVLYIYVKYILNVRVRVTDNLAAIYEVPELGVISVKSDSKKLFAFVDNWIYKLRDWNKRKFTTEEAIGLASVAVKMAAKKADLDEVCCLGCNLKDNAMTVVEVIQNILKDADISMKVLNNVLYDQETLEQLLSARGAFLLERAGETLYDEISREIELLRRQEIIVLGIIILE